jgi:ribosomal protein S18 acetylase RimI-like enzyme
VSCGVRAGEAMTKSVLMTNKCEERNIFYGIAKFTSEGVVMILDAATKDDIKKVSTWLRNSEECKLWGGPKITFPIEIETLLNEIGFYDNKTYVLKADHETEGMGQLIKKNPKTFHIARIIINPNKRGQGRGEILCHELLNEAKTHQEIEHVTLNVYRHNDKAVQLYLKIGFQEIKSREDLNMRMEYKL